MKSVGKVVASPRQAWSPVETVALRTRPGDRPSWLRLDDDLSPDELRATASAHRLPVDVVAALAAEWRLCEPRIAVECQGGLLTAASAALTEPRLIPSDELRAWDRMLGARGPITAEDELPEVCLPQRISCRLPHVLSRRHLPLERLDDVVLCDRAACRLGMNLETWMLATALAQAVDT